MDQEQAQQKEVYILARRLSKEAQVVTARSKALDRTELHMSKQQVMLMVSSLLLAQKVMHYTKTQAMARRK